VPGVTVTTEARGGPTQALRAPSGQLFIAGITERGDSTAPNLVRGMGDVERLLGNRVSYGQVWDQLEVFFAEGGLQAYVARVVGPASAKGSLTLSDRAAAPVNTLRVDAANAGSWSSRVEVEVQDGSTANTFRVIVYLDGEVVDDQNNIASPAEAVTRFVNSPYIAVTNQGSATVAPNNNPAVTPKTALTAGSDDRTSVTTANYTDALDQFGFDLGDGAVAIPGQTGTTAWEAIRAHCVANNRLGIISSVRGDSVANLISQAKALNSEYMGLFAPWLLVSDGAGGTRAISPEGYVAACRTRAHEETGAWRVPAGKIAEAETILDVDQLFSQQEGDDLDASKVSAIRKIAGSVRLYGWRSLSNDQDNFAYLKDRDLLNRIVTDAEKKLEDFVFGTVDAKGQLLTAINAELVGMVDPIRQAGGLYERWSDDGETLIDPGYVVETGPSVNTQQSLSQNRVKANLNVRISPVGGMIELAIVKVGILSGM
jgi:phage tail sheath protein FI